MSFVPLAGACPRCALPLGSAAVCGRCLLHPPAYDATDAAYVYAFPLDRLIQAFKYNGALSLGGWFAEAMLDTRQVPAVGDLIIALPLSPGRQRERGFNHSLEIARILSRRTGIRVAADAAIRVRETPPQATLPWSDRASNVRGAFACPRNAIVAGRSIIVIDDVMTTGASLDEFARTLKRAGAARVENWLVARTLPPDGPLAQPMFAAAHATPLATRGAAH